MLTRRTVPRAERWHANDDEQHQPSAQRQELHRCRFRSYFRQYRIWLPEHRHRRVALHNANDNTHERYCSHYRRQQPPSESSSMVQRWTMLFGKSTHLHEAVGSSERLAPAPHVVSVVQDTDTALLDTRSERYFTLNEVGTRIWELLAERTEIAVIVELLVEEYDAPMDAIAADTQALLFALQKARLVRRV